MKAPALPDIPASEVTPAIAQLFEVVRYQAQVIESLRNEVEELKRTKRRGQKGRKKRRSSGMEGKKGKVGGGKPGGKRPGSEKKSKTKDLANVTDVIVPAEDVPPGSEFKGYKDWTVQDIVIKPKNTRYRMEVWRTPDGRTLSAPLPLEVNGHFGTTLCTYMEHQYYVCHVTQPLLLEQLTDLGVQISSGQINRILIEGHQDLHGEKDAVLQAGLMVSSWIHVDDTGARHKGQPGHMTVIGNDLFAWFGSRPHKSRANFLQLLLGEKRGPLSLDAQAMRYIAAHKLPAKLKQPLTKMAPRTFDDEASLLAFLRSQGLTNKTHCRIVVEGVLWSTLLAQGFNLELAIISDAAKQFDVYQLLNGLCWVHAERNLYTLEPLTDADKAALKRIRARVWRLYEQLKTYRDDPDPALAKRLTRRFERLVATKTGFKPLDAALVRMANNKDKLLLVLERPEIPLHTNAGERDIRDGTKWRKISGGTKSDEGRRARDTFLTLKKTAKKLGISFWDFLRDRNTPEPKLPSLAQTILERGCDPPDYSVYVPA